MKSKLYEIDAKDGCQGCMFRKKDTYADNCALSSKCLSIHRPDKRSIIFSFFDTYSQSVKFQIEQSIKNKEVV